MLEKLTRSLLLSALLISISVFGFAPTVQAQSMHSLSIAGLFSFAGTRPANLGIRNDRFVDCPSTPNCVSSFSTDPTHKIEPFRYTTSPEKAFADLKQTIQSLSKTQIIQQTNQYLYVEFTSELMGFVDDVEFYLDKSAGVIQVRSASRLGESDLGVNRQRIESIRAKLRESGTVG